MGFEIFYDDMEEVYEKVNGVAQLNLEGIPKAGLVPELYDEGSAEVFLKSNGQRIDVGFEISNDVEEICGEKVNGFVA